MTLSLQHLLSDQYLHSNPLTLKTPWLKFVRAIFELWGYADTYEELHKDVIQRTKYELVLLLINFCS